MLETPLIWCVLKDVKAKRCQHNPTKRTHIVATYKNGMKGFEVECQMQKSPYSNKMPTEEDATCCLVETDVMGRQPIATGLFR